MAGPDSSYSSFEIHICWNVESEAKIEPPIQTEYLRSIERKKFFKITKKKSINQ